jgi:hypothetical protein
MAIFLIFSIKAEFKNSFSIDSMLFSFLTQKANYSFKFYPTNVESDLGKSQLRLMSSNAFILMLSGGIFSSEVLSFSYKVSNTFLDSFL